MNKHYEVKFVTTQEEMDEVYKLRYEDLVLEYNNSNVTDDGKDISKYDKCAKHVIVKRIDNGEICGYYRMITSDELKEGDKFICEDEFNIDKLKATNEKICEFSRAVIKKEYRGGVILLLLWGFIFKYIKENNYRYVIGDASFKGINRDEFKNEISYLINNYCIDPKYEIKSRDTLPPMEIVDTSTMNEKELLLKLPPLIRGYINIGAKVADQPFTDFPFGSVDVFVLADINNCNEAYVKKLCCL